MHHQEIRNAWACAILGIRIDVRMILLSEGEAPPPSPLRKLFVRYPKIIMENKKLLTQPNVLADCRKGTLVPSHYFVQQMY